MAIEKLCLDCGQPMKEGFYSTRGTWTEGKSKIKASLNRKFVNTKIKNNQSWICENCHLILFRY